MSGEPFPKAAQLARGERRYRRKVASAKQWQAIAAEKIGPCREAAGHADALDRFSASMSMAPCAPAIEIVSVELETTRQDALCACGHARHWHSHGGEGDCEHDGACACACAAFRADAPRFARPRSYTPEFEIHAAPEAIAAFLDQARERSAAIFNEIGWLEALYSRRLAGDPNSHCDLDAVERDEP